jgi:hypothetical protein
MHRAPSRTPALARCVNYEDHGVAHRSLAARAADGRVRRRPADARRRGHPGAARSQREALRAIARRFGWASLAVLIVTGSALASHDMRWSSGTLQVKFALVITVAALILWHLRRPNARAVEGVVLLVSVAIVWLGPALAHGPLPFG